MDANEGDLMFLVLQASDGSQPLPSPFLVGKSLQDAVGRPVQGNLIDNGSK